MKNFKKLIPLFFISIGVFYYSCQKDGVEHADSEVPADVIEKLASLELNTDHVRFESHTHLDGSVSHGYVVEDCYHVSADQLDEMQLHGGVTSEQYRTYNLVSQGRTINVIGYTGGGNALTSKMRTGLQRAISNFNALGLNLNFNLTFGTNYGDKDIVVYQVSGAAGGVAGFPSGGRPYKWVRIFSGLSGYSTDVHEHVITHEIGHCVGMRHSDWWSRQSCGSGSGESAGSVGAVHIPGTPTGWDSSSLMNACFSSSSSGEFNSNDRTALRYLY